MCGARAPAWSSLERRTRPDYLNIAFDLRVL